ncbi:MAG TPA: chromate transporter [Stellaceae bacterium]|nr:chromate transporter [Stellaceae bacterium]
MPHPDASGNEAGAAVPAIGLARIFWAFFRLGCTSFGGGTAGWLYREMVLRRGWIDDQAFLATMALGQVLPGANGVKMTVLIGQRLRGGAGAAVAFLGLLSGPFAIILAIGTVYAGLSGERLLHQMLDGVAAAVIGLTLATGLRSLSQSAFEPASLTIAAATVGGVGIMRWPMLWVIVGLAPVSIALALRNAHRS